MKKILLSTTLLFSLAASQNAFSVAPSKNAMLRAEMMKMLEQQAAEEEENNKKIEEAENKTAEKQEAARKKQEEGSKKLSALEDRLQNIDSEEALQKFIKDLDKEIKDYEKTKRGSKYIDRNMQSLYKALKAAAHEYKKASNTAARESLKKFQDLPAVDYTTIKQQQKKVAKQPLEK